MEWATLPLYSPGHTALLLTPGKLPASVDIGPLIESVCQHAISKGVHLVQALADPSDPATAKPFLEGHFRKIADLLYLQATPPRNAAPPQLPPGFTLQTYTPQTHDHFSQAIAESYRDSLDCPALNGMRTIADVIAGHRSSGEFDPATWFLLTEGTTPAAVLLLNRVPRSDMAELVYLGLSPMARGRGIGNLLVRHALAAVCNQMRLAKITLAVDSRNIPALKLYYRHGMQQIGTKTAMLRDLRTHPARPVT
jgi:RimJ/RimL family protein N-acetyltransferase